MMSIFIHCDRFVLCGNFNYQTGLFSKQNENGKSHTSVQVWEQTPLHKLQIWFIVTTVLQHIHFSISDWKDS